MYAKHGAGLRTYYRFARTCYIFTRWWHDVQQIVSPKSIQPQKRENLRVSRLAIVFWTFQRQTAKAPLDVKAGLVERAVVAFCNTLINICQTEKSERIRHVPFLHLQAPGDESIVGTTERGVLLNFITGLAGERERRK